MRLPCVILRRMSTVKEIESAVAQLSAKELAKFRQWFAEFDAAEWDKEFEEDVKAGRLDKLAEQAIKEYRAGRCTKL